MRSLKIRAVRVLASLSVGGSCLQLGACGLDGLGNFVSNFNPCLTILLCDPVAYRFDTSGYRGPGVDPDIDPSCTYPPYCSPPYGANADPFVNFPGFEP
ncbi:MAG: hypothetical protein AB7Q17_16090 [Phycisphaerae bacterium]